MKKMHFKSLNYTITLDEPIKGISIEDPSIYRDIALNIYNEIIYSIDDKLFDLEKESIIIYDPLNINLNDIKLLKGLYKKLEKEIHFSFEDKLNNIEKDIFEIVEMLSNNSELSLDYSPLIDVSKLFSSVNIQYRRYETYLENLLQYFKAYYDIYSTNVVISFGLVNCLTNKEIESLKKELIYLGINVLDISSTNKSTVSSLIVDEDWCIL